MRQDFLLRHSLPVPGERALTPLYVINTGREMVQPNEPYPLTDNSLYGFDWAEGRVLPEFCLAWIQRGSGVLEVKSGCQSVPEKRAFLFRPNEWHRHRPDDQIGWTLYWMSFNGDLPQKWMIDGDFALDGNLPLIGDPGLFEAQFDRLLRTVDESPVKNSDALSSQAAGLLSHFLRHDDSPHFEHAAHNDEIVNRAVEFIWNHHWTFIGVPEVVEQVEVGRRTLERRFTAVLGRSILEEIQLCRFNRAKRLIEDSSLPLKKIVYLAGFRSRHQLRLLFHQYLKVSPEAYRESFTAVLKSTEIEQ
jgi:AraC-like DNA-binding protein